VPLDKMPGGAAFNEKYKKTFNQEIQIYAPYAFDAANVLIAAMTQAGSADPKVYLPVLAAIEHDGVTGKIRFDKNGDIEGGSISLYKANNGQWEYIETVAGGMN
jgi:branched-chain amino acid transport system substrate-binding protein